MQRFQKPWCIKCTGFADALVLQTQTASTADFIDAPAYYQQPIEAKSGNAIFLKPITSPAIIAVEYLKNIDAQLEVVRRNTQRFVEGFPANNILLTGALGTGKSSLFKACLNAFAEQGLRLIEIDKERLVDLPGIMDLINGRAEKFIIFCDDLLLKQVKVAINA